MKRAFPAAALGLALALVRPATACCQLGGAACGDPVAIDCNNGVVCFVPWRTCPSCTCTTTGSGRTCLQAASEPGAVAALRVDRSLQTPGALDLSWGASCAASGPDYSVHEGLIGAWYSHTPLVCSSAGALSLTLAPSSGDRYYLVAPIAAGFTGSFGASSAGVERPDGEPSCTGDRALAPCP